MSQTEPMLLPGTGMGDAGVAKGPFSREFFVRQGRKGGRKAAGKGGKARAAKMTAQERSEAARKAVQARWAKAKGKKKP